MICERRKIGVQIHRSYGLPRGVFDGGWVGKTPSNAEIN